MKDDALIRRIVWEKGQRVPGFDPNVVRRDSYGRLMLWDDYEDRASPYGWEIDQVYQGPLGGPDDTRYLEPLNRQSNLEKEGRLLELGFS
jgi:hypothetical protein